MSARTGTTAADRRFAARARQSRRRRVGRIFVGFVVLVLLGGLGWLIGWSDAFAVQEVHVERSDSAAADDGENDDVVAAEDIIGAADVAMGTPLIRIDTDGIADRVAEVPEVADVVVHRSWPSAVTLEITARTAVATVPDGEDTWWRVDADGVLFGVDTSQPEELTVLRAGLDDDSAPERAAGVAVLDELPAEILDRVQEIRVESAADVRMELDDDIDVRWGTADNTSRKADVLLALMAEQEDLPDVYDVSAPEAPAVDP